MKEKKIIIITSIICLLIGYISGQLHQKLNSFGEQVHVNLEVKKTMQNCTLTINELSQKQENQKLINEAKDLNNYFDLSYTYDYPPEMMKELFTQYNDQLIEIQNEIKKND